MLAGLLYVVGIVCVVWAVVAAVMIAVGPVPSRTASSRMLLALLEPRPMGNNNIFPVTLAPEEG